MCSHAPRCQRLQLRDAVLTQPYPSRSLPSPNNRGSTPCWLQFFKLYTELLKSDNYVTRRQSLKLLGELLLDRSNVKIMMQVSGWGCSSLCCGPQHQPRLNPALPIVPPLHNAWPEQDTWRVLDAFQFAANDACCPFTALPRSTWLTWTTCA